MARNELHFAIVVGINRYPGLRNLRLAKGDAEKFAEWLLDPAGGGLPSDQDPQRKLPAGHVIKIVVDDASVPDNVTPEQARPVRKEVSLAFHQIRKQVEAHVASNPADWHRTRFYFYVSGHGIAPDARDAALLMADASQEAYDENISCDRLLSFLGKRQPFAEVVIFADCCRERVGNVPLGTLSGTLGDGDNGPVKAVLCCATHFGDLAYEPPADEDPDQQRGYFTRALLEGLGGQAADPPISGEINSNTIAKYVKQRVQDLTKHRQWQQDPNMQADPAAPIVFRAASSASTGAAPMSDTPAVHQIRIIFVTDYQGKVELRDSANEVLHTHDTATGDLVASLPNGLYEVTPQPPGDVHFKKAGNFRVLGESKNVEL